MPAGCGVGARPSPALSPAHARVAAQCACTPCYGEEEEINFSWRYFLYPNRLRPWHACLLDPGRQVPKAHSAQAMAPLPAEPASHPTGCLLGKGTAAALPQPWPVLLPAKALWGSGISCAGALSLEYDQMPSSLAQRTQ